MEFCIKKMFPNEDDEDHPLRVNSDDDKSKSKNLK